MSFLGKAIDRVIEEAFPSWAARRYRARVVCNVMRQTRAFEAGKSDRLSGRANWSRLGPIEKGRRDLEATRAQARDLYRLNPYAHGIVNSIVANLIGNGMRPHPRVMLRTQKPNIPFNDLAEEEWNGWAKAADTSGRKSFYHIQTLVQRELCIVGEVLIAKSIPTDGRRIPLALEVIQSERLADVQDRALTGGAKVIQGVEFDASGQIVAYWIYPSHPGDSVSFSMASRPERIPADRIIHLYDDLEPGQVRGLTRFLTTAGTCEAMMQWLDWVMVKERVASAFALMITQNIPNMNTLANGDGEKADDDGNPLSQLEGGMLINGKPGEGINGVSSGIQGAQVDILSQLFIRQLARGQDVSYELASRDLSKVTYLSARQGENQDRRHWEPQQAFLNEQFNCPIWQEFIRAAVFAGFLQIPRTAQPDNFCAVDFVPDGWDWIDPDKDLKADIAAIQAGLMSPIEAVARRGGDIWKILDDLESVKFTADEKGLDLAIFHPPGAPQLPAPGSADAPATDTPTDANPNVKPVAA